MHAPTSGVIFAFFFTVRTQTQTTILSFLLDLGQQASTATYFSTSTFSFQFQVKSFV